MEKPKLCPFAAANPQLDNSYCLGEACACYVKMHKPRLMQSDQCKMVDSKFFYHYKGCGLVTHVPWELAKHEENPKTTQT
jgi:hypothetical protein